MSTSLSLGNGLLQDYGSLRVEIAPVLIPASRFSNESGRCARYALCISHAVSPQLLEKTRAKLWIAPIIPIDDYALIPFGGGRRTCIARELARLEATLATIGQQFNLEWAGDETDMVIEPEMTTKTQNGLPMTLRRR